MDSIGTFTRQDEALSSLSLELVCIVITSPLIFFYIFVKLCAVASKVGVFSSFIALGYLVGDHANIYITEPIVLIYIYIFVCTTGWDV